MRVASVIVAVFLSYLMFPGALELTENAAHVVVHGDIAHGSGHEHEQQGREHGCSGPYHVCMCHQSTAFVPVITTPFAPARKVHAVPVPVRPPHAHDSGYTTRVYRPPRA